MIHLCGTHTQHIPLKKMPSLRAVQVNDRAAQDLEIYLREMPEKIYYVNPCEGMPIERIEELAKTRKVVICAEPVQRIGKIAETKADRLRARHSTLRLPSGRRQADGRIDIRPALAMRRIACIEIPFRAFMGLNGVDVWPQR